MNLFGRKPSENRINSIDDKIYEDENIQENESKYNNEKQYVIKILMPIDQYGTEFSLFYNGMNNTMVKNLKFAKVYDSFEIARQDSNDITEKYKNIGVWVPTRVVVDKYNGN